MTIIFFISLVFLHDFSLISIVMDTSQWLYGYFVCTALIVLNSILNNIRTLCRGIIG